MIFAEQTVQAFFENSNWQGLKIVESATIETDFEDNLTVLNLSFTVEEYFASHNWQGLAVVKKQSKGSSSQSTSGSMYSLNMTVQEFFQRMVWHGVKKTSTPIANQSATKKVSPPTKNQLLNLQDLSDLL